MIKTSCMSGFKRLVTLMTVVFVLAYVQQGMGQTATEKPEQMPVLGWYSIPPEQTTVSRYKELKASGITCSFTFFPDTHSLARALKAAHEAGVKIIICCPELRSETEKTVKTFMHDPALAGYFLQDEPAPKDFSMLGNWVKKIRSIDDTHFCYINLLPNYADIKSLGVKDYREYIHQFIDEVPVKLLTFDFYPVIGDTIRENWYKNLEVISNEAQKAGKPFWAFALTTAHETYPVATLAQLRLQVYSNLAYGAQGIEYFTYWTPKSNIWDFHHGPITIDGKRTEVYDRIKKMNHEIQQVSDVFLGAEVIGVFHTGAVIPPGTKRLAKLPSPIKMLSTDSSGALVSILKKDQYRFVVIVNRNFKKNMALNMVCDTGVMKILKDGSAVPANNYIDTMKIDPGDIAIYRWVKK